MRLIKRLKERPKEIVNAAIQRLLVDEKYPSRGTLRRGIMVGAI